VFLGGFAPLVVSIQFAALPHEPPELPFHRYESLFVITPPVVTRG
jgi:hypothetical protein